eukprot:278685_1
MKGISIEKAELTLGGFVDDRLYAVVNKATNKVINQVAYPRLTLIAVAFKDGSDNLDAGIQLNDQFVPFVKDKTLHVEWKSCSTKILAYDQGEAVSKWITSFLNADEEDARDEFIFVRIHEENYRESEEYFALPSAPKGTQRMSAFQNYAPVMLGSQESLDELNRRYRQREHGPDWCEKELGWDRFRHNVILSGVLKAHHEDFMKHITFGDLSQESAQIVWSRRRRLCAVQLVNPNTGIRTVEPIATAQAYRNAIIVNDRTARMGDGAVFFGSLFCVKRSGMVHVGQRVVSSQVDTNSIVQYAPFELLSKEEYNHDTIKVRFGMVVKGRHAFRKSLKEALRLGDHYLFKYLDQETPIIRAYTPLPGDGKESKMSFDLLVKLYPNGRMSQHLNHMKIGDTILCKKNCGKVCYFEVGKIRFCDAPYHLNVSKLNLIAGGSGITPMYQIIANIHLNKAFDKTQISLVYANKSEKDIWLRNELEAIEKGNQNIKVHFIIEDDSNQFDVGRVNVEICKQYLFPPSVDSNARTVTLLCGPCSMQKAVKRCLTKIGYDDKSVTTF